MSFERIVHPVMRCIAVALLVMASFSEAALGESSTISMTSRSRATTQSPTLQIIVPCSAATPSLLCHALPSQCGATI